MTRTTSIEVDGLDLRSIAAKARIGNAQWRIAQTLKRLIEEHQAQCAGCDMQFIQLYEDCEVLGIPVL